jgi:hypothetical protein
VLPDSFGIITLKALHFYYEKLLMFVLRSGNLGQNGYKKYHTFQHIIHVNFPLRKGIMSYTTFKYYSKGYSALHIL